MHITFENGEYYDPLIDQIQRILFREASTVRFFENIKFLLLHGYKSFEQAEQELIRYRKGKPISIMNPKSKGHQLLGSDKFQLNNGTTNFDIYSIYLVNLANVKGIKSLIEEGKDYIYIKENRKEVKNRCKSFRHLMIDDTIVTWRNKVAAHYAASDPFKEDNIPTLIQSINSFPSYIEPYYEVGAFKLHINDEESQIPRWSVTKAFESSQKFWPNYRLEPLIANDQGLS